MNPMLFIPTGIAMGLVVAQAAAQAPVQPGGPPHQPKIEPMPMAFPPAPVVITEVLYRVPRGEAGDAGRDGKRQATGDEFVELTNLSDKPVQLKGYRLLDSNCYGMLTDKGKNPFHPSEVKADGRHFAFVFPELELKPGQVVVVFNGFEGLPTGPVGKADKAPEPNPGFGGAFVFAIRPEDKYSGFGDKGDWVMLVADDGELLEAVGWGVPETAAPMTGGRNREVKNEPVGSITRTSRMSGFRDHAEVYGGVLFSPGVFSPKVADGSAVESPRRPDQK